MPPITRSPHNPTTSSKTPVIPTDQREWRNPQLLFTSFARTKLIPITANAYASNDHIQMEERVYAAYIVTSRSRTLYIGVTGDLRRRVFQHKWKEYEGFSAKYNCDRLVWFENYQHIASAIRREAQLKKWNRSKKIVLIEEMNPAWLDLSRDWYEYEPQTTSAPPIAYIPNRHPLKPSVIPTDQREWRNLYPL